jgi:outer membrane receptor protein involved in Fe transport
MSLVVRSRVAGWLCALGGLIAVPGAALAQTGTGSITGKVLDRESGKGLDYANVVILGTTFGANSLNGGNFNITLIPPGTYELRASFVGYEPQTIVDVRVDAGQPTPIEFRLKKGDAGTVQTIIVTSDAKKVDVKASDVSHVQTDKEMLTLPVESVAEAVALNTGVVVQGGEMHVRGGRGSEISVRIDGVPVDDPLSGGSQELGILSTAQSELVTGGMDAEYGNASSAIINLTTKSGGKNFEGNFRYRTDDYGRADKTFTNFDQVALGIGGPTPFKDLTYYISGEASFQDGEFLTTKRYPQHEYLGGALTVKERASSDFKGQGRLDWKVSSGVKMSGELTLSQTKDDAYLHNWTTEGYVAKLVEYPRLRKNRFQAEYFSVGGSVLMYDGAWRQEAQNATYVDIRQDLECVHCLLPVSDNSTVRAVRVRDFQGQGGGNDPDQWFYALIDFVIFEGFQGPISTWVSELEGAAGDTNKVYFNSAEHTATATNNNQQIKWTLTHTLSPKTFYEVKLSRLAFDVEQTVNGQRPEEYATAGKFIWVPGRGPVRTGNIDFYTDDDYPYFVTAYDHPAYNRRNTVTYLLRSDITSQRWRGHRVKGGLMVMYNDMDQASFTFPGQQREFGDPYGFGRNEFHNFNPEGSFYGQDRWEYEGMVLNAGLRFDFFSPGSGVGVMLNSDEIRRDIQRWQTQWSPRIGLAFPITDRDVFHFHYGRFIQFPEKQFIFASQDVNVAITAIGNPNLEPETSIAYQAGIKHQFTNDLSGQFALYNKDYFGLVSSVQVQDDSTGQTPDRFVNKAFANTRGIELNLSKAFSNHYAFEVAYTYQFADGVASEADFGQRASGLTYIPNGELPLDWDQRHTVNTTLSIANPGDWSGTMVYKYGSGFPWTPFFRFERRQDPLLENSRRHAPTHVVDFRGEKFFSVYGKTLRLFFDGRNLLDERIVVSESPTVFPGLENATNGYLSYATERGRFGGAYLKDTDGDGTDEFFPVNDPRVYGERRLFRIGIGFEF